MTRIKRSLVVVLLATSLAAAAADSPRMPTYDPDGRLERPDGYREWILAGSALGLGYDEGGGGHDLFHNVLIEPTAYRHFAEAGEFREGTMLALLLHQPGASAVPARKGQFADGFQALELAVKDSTQGDEAWAYYDFGGAGGLRDTARPFPAKTCHACHAEHAQRDNVFLQFYSLLRAVDPLAAVPLLRAAVPLLRAAVPLLRAAAPLLRAAD